MKAEQRKELETNTLADRMGHLVQRVKGGERRTFLIYFIVVAAIFVAGFLGYRWYYRDVQETSMHWVMLYDGSRESIGQLAGNPEIANKPAGKAARLQVAWMWYWDEGVKLAAADQLGSMNQIKKASKIYEDLVTDCKDDPTFEPQAMLGVAICAESLAVQDRANLKRAKSQYLQLVEKYPDTAEGKFAKKRQDILSNDTSFKALSKSYEDLQRLLGVPGPFQMPGGLNFRDIPGHQ
jgi:hypothetical protein